MKMEVVADTAPEPGPQKKRGRLDRSAGDNDRPSADAETMWPNASIDTNGPSIVHKYGPHVCPHDHPRAGGGRVLEKSSHRRLFAANSAPETAISAYLVLSAAPCSARHHVDVPAEFLQALFDQFVPPACCARVGVHRQPCRHGVECFLEFSGGKCFDAGRPRPFGEHEIGRAERGGEVDHGSTAERRSCKDPDAEIGGRKCHPVEVHIASFGLDVRKVRLGPIPALFHDDHIEARFSEDGGSAPSRRAGSNDHNVALELLIRIDLDRMKRLGCGWGPYRAGLDISSVPTRGPGTST